jgi:Ser/Thr protein kinase RdoA (MazF antagonist)
MSLLSGLRTYLFLPGSPPARISPFKGHSSESPNPSVVLRTALTQPELDVIAREFSLGPVTASYLDGGARNTSYLLSGPNQRFVATVLERRDLASALAYGAFLGQIAAVGIPTPRPLKTRDRRWAYPIGGKPVMVTPFVEGSTVGALSESELFELGALLAKVHNSGISFNVSRALNLLEPDISWLTSEEEDPFPQWALQRRHQAADMAPKDGRCVITHGDPFRDNIILAPNRSLILIDWEDAALDHPVVDLALALLSHAEETPDLSYAECLHAGYTREHPTCDIRLRDILRTAAYAGLVIAYRRYRRHVEGFADANPYLSMWKLADSLLDLQC